MRNLFCIMWHHVTIYTATICNYCIYSCIVCILCDVYVQFVCNLDLPFRVPLEAVRRQSNGWPMGWLPCLKWRHKIQSVHQHLLCGQSCGMIWVYYKVIQIWSICVVYIGYLLPRDTFHLAEIPCIPLLHLRGQFCKDQSRANKQVVDEKIRDSLHFFEAWAWKPGGFVMSCKIVTGIKTPSAAARQQLADMEEISSEASWRY